MQANVFFVFLILGVTWIEAGPAPKTIEKSVAEDTKIESIKEDLKIDETGEDKNRAKKAALCLQIEPGYSQQGQFIINENQAAVQNIPLSVQAQSIPQQVQTLGFLQSLPQNIPQGNYIMPQQMVQPMQPLQIVQPQILPCIQSAAVNLIQPALQTNTIQTIQKVQPTPKTTPAPMKEPVTEPPKPIRMEEAPQPLPAPQENIAILPAAPAYEHFMLFPQPEPNCIPVPQVPSCSNPLHGLVTECTCQRVNPMGMNMMPLISYPGYSASSMVMPQQIAAKENAAPYGWSRSYMASSNPHANHHHEKMYQRMRTYGASGQPAGMISTPFASGLTLNTLPQGYRAVDPLHQPLYSFMGNTLRSKHNAMDSPVNSEVHDLVQSNKTPPKVDATELSPEKEAEIKQEGEQATLIDGRRNTRSNKEEKKDLEKQFTKQ